MAGKKQDARKRFFDKVLPVTESGCHLWTGYCNKLGYGIFYIEREFWYAHRIAYKFHYGLIDESAHVLHKCDVPCCVNPGHLYLGTQADNNRDRDNRNRHVALRGADNGMAKLDEHKVRLIRASNESSVQLSKRIGINSSSIRKIRRNEAWVHVT